MHRYVRLKSRSHGQTCRLVPAHHGVAYPRPPSDVPRGVLCGPAAGAKRPVHLLDQIPHRRESATLAPPDGQKTPFRKEKYTYERPRSGTRGLIKDNRLSSGARSLRGSARDKKRKELDTTGSFHSINRSEKACLNNSLINRDRAPPYDLWHFLRSTKAGATAITAVAVAIMPAAMRRRQQQFTQRGQEAGSCRVWANISRTDRHRLTVRWPDLCQIKSPPIREGASRCKLV